MNLTRLELQNASPAKLATLAQPLWTMDLQDPTSVDRTPQLLGTLIGLCNLGLESQVPGVARVCSILYGGIKIQLCAIMSSVFRCFNFDSTFHIVPATSEAT
jgi:hypothetical protein